MQDGVLYETHRIIKGGKYVGSRVVWSTERIGAEVCEGKIDLKRICGRSDRSFFPVTIEELGSLNTQSVIWMQEREGWAAFYSSSAGYPPGMVVGAYRYLAPGKDSKPVEVGVLRGDVVEKGEAFCGKEEVRGFANSFNREIWRVGERYGNPAGEQVGKIHQISERLVVEARRKELTLRIGERWTTIEPDEDAFLCALYLWAKNQSN